MKIYLLLIAVVLFIAGCGGGGSSSSGTVRGTLSNLPSAQRRGSETFTVRVEGTDLFTTVEPGSQFSLGGIPPGLHTLIIENDRYGKAIVIQVGSKLVTEIGEIAVEDAGKIAGTVTDAETNAPIAGAVVTVTEAIPTMDSTTNIMPHPVRMEKTADDGTYSFMGIVPGSYIVNIAAHGYVSSSMIIDVVAQAVANGSIALKKDIVIPTDTGTLKGTVYLESDGVTSPLAGALVRLRPVLENSNDIELNQPVPAMLYQVVGDGNRPVKVDPATGYMDSIPDCPRELIAYTDENGNYLIENIPIGNYHAQAVSPGMDIKGVRAVVSITANGSIVQDFTLTLKHINNITVTGTVTDDVTKKPVANAGVRCILGYRGPSVSPAMKRGTQGYQMNAASGDGVVIKPSSTGNPDGGSMVIYAVTDTDGKYKVMSPAISGVAVTAVGYAPQDKEVANDVMLQTVDFALSPLQVGTIAGVVKDEAGVGIAGAKIYADYPVYYADGNTSTNAAITNIGRPEYRATISDADGKFSIDTLPGTVTLYVKMEGYQPSQKAVEVTANTETAVEIVLKALKFGKITGVVKDSVTNLPIAGATVNRNAIYYGMDTGPKPSDLPGSSISPGVSAPEQVETDADGKFTLDNIPVGEAALTCIKEGYELNYKTVTVVETTPTQADFSLIPLPKPAIVFGIVTGPDDKPIAGAIVSAADMYYIAAADRNASRIYPPPSNDWVAKTDENGAYRLSLPAWVTEISVVTRGYKKSITPVTLQAGVETELNVKLELNSITNN